jgi:hypothetical protein
MIFTRQQYIDLLKHRINTEFGKDPKTRKKSIAIANYCNPTKTSYDRTFIRILLSGLKFAGISHNNHDITPAHVEALINFLQVCSWTDFYIAFKLFSIMPLISMGIQLIVFSTLLTSLLKHWI